MAYHILATIKLKPEKIQDFIAILHKLTPLFGKHGWKLVGSYETIFGEINTVVDLWELPNLTAMEAALSDPEILKFTSDFTEIADGETMQLMTKIS